MGRLRIGAGPKPDRRAVELEARFNQPGDSLPARDPAQAKQRDRSSFANQGFIVFGRVVDYVAYARTYKVQCERGMPALRCCDAAVTGLGVVGARQLATYTLGQGVLVFYHPKALYHTILCSVPDWMANPRDSVSDAIVQGSNVGLQVDSAHNFPFLLQNGGGVIDFSAGRPTDSLSGDWGAISALGGRVFLDDFQVQVAMDEETGLFLCYFDQYASLRGHNLDLRSAGFLREDRDDESEYSSVAGYTPFFWESLGLYASSGTPSMELSATEVQRDSPNRTRLEPISDRQLGIYREVEYHGYLGQGGHKQVVTPVEVDAIHTYDSPAAALVGMSDEVRTLDGVIGLRAARGVYIAKTPYIGAPKRTDRPESKTGDRTADNYASCGLFGSGPQHQVAGDPANVETVPHAVEAASVLDLVSYLFNWKGLHPFHYHNRDWAVSQESEMAASAGTYGSSPDYNQLQSQTYLDQAASFSVHVDDRYGLVEYYANIACWGLLPNGGIVQVDGWGVEQRSAGGNQYMFAPGDFVINAARNIVLQAGHSVILKGYHGVDVNSSVKAVRIAAGTDVMIMGGNEGCGGVLIESKAAGPDMAIGTRADGEDKIGGVVLRSKNSSVAVLAKNIVAATNAWGDNAEGHITIDAGADARIITRSAEFHRHIGVYAIDVFPSHNNEYWPGRTLLGGELLVAGEIFATQQIVSAAEVVAAGDLVGAGTAVVGSTALAAIAADVTEINDRDVSTAVADSLTDLTFLTDNTDVALLEFYFRGPANLLTTDYLIHEPVWAQIARGTTGVPATWEETPVTGDAHDDSAPYPGLDVWFGVTYGQRDPNLFDPLGMCAADRGAAYENATLNETTWVTPDSNWPIIKGRD